MVSSWQKTMTPSYTTSPALLSASALQARWLSSCRCRWMKRETHILKTATTHVRPTSCRCCAELIATLLTLKAWATPNRMASCSGNSFLLAWLDPLRRRERWYATRTDYTLRLVRHATCLNAALTVRNSFLTS